MHICHCACICGNIDVLQYPCPTCTHPHVPVELELCVLSRADGQCTLAAVKLTGLGRAPCSPRTSGGGGWRCGEGVEEKRGGSKIQARPQGSSGGLLSDAGQ
uniref:Uncharacterized protein n=1 Tax=Knipowitschia caucasica TaxID=637954 RepID=A0AAV2JE65_KNICA